MTKQELFKQIQDKKTFLCVGLDSDIQKIPAFLSEKYDDPVFEFNKAIVDATADYCVAYKPNLAFYENSGVGGLDTLDATVAYIQQNYPDHFIIADAKRGDIGNTSAMYAKAFFGNKVSYDAVTVAPYMGEDSVMPFLTYPDKWVILLALTSNKGAFDFQFMRDAETGERLFEKVLKASLRWGNAENMMYVVGATKAEMLTDIRAIVPDHFLLVPGVGAQGGSLQEVAKYGMNSTCGLLVNSSRQIIFASGNPDFAQAARTEACKVQQEMEQLLAEYHLL